MSYRGPNVARMPLQNRVTPMGEIVADPDGRPWLTVSGTVAAAAAARGIARWHLSLSHDGGIASAMVVAES